jgi:cell wall-associated NlpC family hydrolase
MALGSTWTHAAIYVGDGDVVDATGKFGIDRQSIWAYVESRRTTLRRIDDPSISRADIDNIAACAKAHIGEPYSVLQVVLAKLGWRVAQTPNRNALYCSTFAGLVVAEATGIELASKRAYQPLFPAVLAAHPDLTTVPLEWRNI